MFHVNFIPSNVELNKSSRAEYNEIVVPGGAGKGAGSIIVSIAISLWAPRLEYLRVSRRLARRRSAIRAGAAILWLVVCKARALAPDDRAVLPSHGQLIGAAIPIDVDRAARRRAVSTGGADRDGQVKSVDEADVVEISALVSC